MVWAAEKRQALTRRVLTVVQVRRCGVTLWNETRVKEGALAVIHSDPQETQLLTHSDFESPYQLGSLQLRPDLD